jgi:hypothetical protein
MEPGKVRYPGGSGTGVFFPGLKSGPFDVAQGKLRDSP